jgi:hypothetical protein
MGAASGLEPDASGYDPDVGEASIPSRLDNGAPADDLRSYDELSDAECERLAAPQGWKPLAVYRGPPGQWSTAREFLKRADAEMPILRAQNRRMTEKLASYDNEFAQLRNTLNTQATTISEQKQILVELREFSRNASEEGYKRARAELEARQDEAAANADQTTVRQTREQIRALDDSRAAAAPQRTQESTEPPADRQAPPPPDPEVARAFAALKRKEPWIGRDDVLTRALIEIDAENVVAYPQMAVAERFDVSVATLKEQFPQFFPTARSGTGDEEIDLTERREPAPPARAGSRPGAPPPNRQRVASPDTIASIPDADDRAQARIAFDRYKRQFPDYTEKEYMAIYNNPKADVRQLRQEARKRV